MKTIYVNFLGFHPDLNIEDNSLYKLLKEKFDIRISKDAQYVFIGSFDPYSYIQETQDKITIFHPGEAISTDFNFFDYGIGFDNFEYGDRYFRFLPLAVTLKRGTSINHIENPFDRKFCNFIYANPDAHPYRDKFFHLLNTYKKVDSLGSHLKNVNYDIEPRHGNWYQGSIDIKSQYKFSLSFENSIFRGYTSEKIISSFQAKSVPIYWGNPNVTKEIDPDGFINCHDYETLDEVIEVIKIIDTDKNKYLKMLNSAKSIFLEDTFYARQNENLLDFLENIFNQEFESAKRRPIGYWTDRQMNSIIKEESTKNTPFLKKIFGKKS